MLFVRDGWIQVTSCYKVTFSKLLESVIVRIIFFSFVSHFCYKLKIVSELKETSSVSFISTLVINYVLCNLMSEAKAARNSLTQFSSTFQDENLRQSEFKSPLWRVTIGLCEGCLQWADTHGGWFQPKPFFWYILAGRPQDSLLSELGNLILIFWMLSGLHWLRKWFMEDKQKADSVGNKKMTLVALLNLRRHRRSLPSSDTGDRLEN